jgi:hypothetical protein
LTDDEVRIFIDAYNKDPLYTLGGVPSKITDKMTMAFEFCAKYNDFR